MTMDVMGAVARLLNSDHPPDDLLNRLSNAKRFALARAALKDLLTEDAVFSLSLMVRAAQCCDGDHAEEMLEELSEEDRTKAAALVTALGGSGKRTLPLCPEEEPTPFTYQAPMDAQADLAVQQAAALALQSVGPVPAPGLKGVLGFVAAGLGLAAVRAVLPAALRRGLDASDLTNPTNHVP